MTHVLTNRLGNNFNVSSASPISTYELRPSMEAARFGPPITTVGPGPVRSESSMPSRRSCSCELTTLAPSRLFTMKSLWNRQKIGPDRCFALQPGHSTLSPGPAALGNGSTSQRVAWPASALCPTSGGPGYASSSRRRSCRAPACCRRRGPRTSRQPPWRPAATLRPQARTQARTSAWACPFNEAVGTSRRYAVRPADRFGPQWGSPPGKPNRRALSQAAPEGG